jgi:hypothetical protein
VSLDIADPRTPSETVAAAHSPLIELAEARLEATSETRADEIDRVLTGVLTERLRSGEALLLADTIAAAPSVAIARQLWRRLIDAWALASRADSGDGVAAALFAIPVVVVAGSQSNTDGSLPTAAISGLLADTGRLVAILREHGALAGNQAFGFANALVAADAVDVPKLSELLAWQTLAASSGVRERDLPPTPIAVQPGQQGVYLRFLIGTALTGRGTDVLAAADMTGWAMPFALELARQLASPTLSVLALPRSPQSPPAALQQGRAAQREVGAQLFASNAIRKLRAAVGEPSAVISAHRSTAAPGGGELRLSLSSPFDSRQAEGFRCPLFPTDRASDVAAMLVDLLRDCRVTDVRILPGVHADRDPQTGMTLLFKADAIGDAEPTSLH